MNVEGKGALTTDAAARIDQGTGEVMRGRGAGCP